MPTEADRPRAPARGAKPARVGELGKAAPARRPPLRSSRALRVILDDLGAAKATLQSATDALRAVDARIHGWDRTLPDGFLARRALVLHDEATARFAASLDELHALLVRLSDRSASPAFSSRLRAAGTRRLQARVHRELRALQRAFQGSGALLARSLDAF